MERCPARLRANCPLSQKACGVVLHHLFFPKKVYEDHSPLAAQFRELNFNKVPMCKHQEIELHKALPAVPVPTTEVMEHCVSVERERRELAVRDLRRP